MDQAIISVRALRPGLHVALFGALSLSACAGTDHSPEDPRSLKPDGGAVDDPTGPGRPDGGLPGDADAGAEPDDTPRLALDGSHWTRTVTDSDVDCFWDNGYRHIVFGTQILEVTRQQLEIAIRGGMTVDLYVYLYWDESISEQVQEAVDLTVEFPEIGRIWIDLEESPAGRSSDTLIGLTEEALDTVGSFPVGIYTGKGFWFDAMDNRDVFSDLPLWYARYDDVPSLDTYVPGGSHAFGGWQAAMGKQFDDHSPATCGRAVDKNVMIRNVVPEVFVDRSIPADDGDAPPMLDELRPHQGLVVNTDYVRPTAPASREADSYELAIEHWNGSSFLPYWTTTTSESSLTLFPTLNNRSYRWRIRAGNGHGFGPWSAWAWFDFGAVSDPPSAQDIQS